VTPGDLTRWQDGSVLVPGASRLRAGLLRGLGHELATEMNGGPCRDQHGAPVRVRLENQLVFEMVK